MKIVSIFLILVITVSSIISEETASERTVNNFAQRRIAKLEVLQEKERARKERIFKSIEAYDQCKENYKEQTLKGLDPNYDCSEKLIEIEKINLKAAKRATKQAIFGHHEEEKKLEAFVSQRVVNITEKIDQNLEEYEAEKERILAAEKIFRNCNENYKAEYADGKKPPFLCANKFINTTGISLLGTNVYKADESLEIRKLKRELKREVFVNLTFKYK
ncbi:hypothetical protein A3F66_01070 [candidate division TM6 bacterium RIFCSPHIGHO2_12_FULL_32_22]|nr:MAG: hypothetical protein A3F66_01070 [candidate division TM6 bacterium RIFCSPHIGHO2_12_FULL_32_22]